MAKQEFDLIVIGGGPGGYVAAIRGAQLGMSVALVEANHLGGICLNWGCIPTKALLRSAEVMHLIKNADQFGISVKDVSFDLTKIVDRSRKVAAQLSGGIKHLLKKNKVTIFDGWGKLTKSKEIVVENDGKEIATLKGKHTILATGARARVLPGLEPDEEFVWSYREAMVPKELPKSILVIGSGAIGIEFASFYNDLGVEVTVVEMADKILPVEDDEISGLALKALKKDGIFFHTGSVAEIIDKGKGTVKIVKAGGKEDDKGQTITVDKVISAVGIVGNVENLGLEDLKVEVDRSHIKVNQWLETAEPGIYAIGDVVNPPWLAHKASHEAIICVEKIAGSKDVHPLDPNLIPGCTYARPQIASLGLTEQACSEQGLDVNIGRFPFVANGKAIALGDTEGMIKTIFDAKTGELLGAHLIGAEVTELIQGYTIGKTLETTEAELMHTVFPHPTLSEMMHESVLDAYGRAIHF